MIMATQTYFWPGEWLVDVVVLCKELSKVGRLSRLLARLLFLFSTMECCSALTTLSGYFPDSSNSMAELGHGVHCAAVCFRRV